MSNRHNIWKSGNNEVTDSAVNFHKINEKGDLVDSKVRKFFFVLRDKQVERDLRVSIFVVTGEGIEDQQKIVLELTNDANPIFLFTLSITKDDFEVLKNDQGINVEFKDFPSALVNLFDKCAERSLGSAGNFKLMLENYNGTVSGGCLMNLKKFQIKVIEENSFKNMCHLTLEILCGSDLQIQQKLEAEICKTKQCLLQETRLHEEAIKKVSGLVEELNERNKDIENYKQVIDDMKNQREAEIHKELVETQCREKQFKDEYEKKINQIQEQLKKKYDKLQKDVLALEEEIKKLHEKEHEMELIICEREKDKEVTAVDMNLLRLEVTQLRSQNSKLDSDYHDKEKSVNILRTRLAVAEQELKDHANQIVSHQNKLEEVYEEKIELCKKLDCMGIKIEKKETVIVNLSEELMKANEIISKQQSKITKYSSQLKANEVALQEKENLIQEKSSSLIKQSEKINQYQNEIEKVNTQLNDLKNKYILVENDLKKKIEELASNEKIMNLLKNKFMEDYLELNDFPQKSLLSYRTFLSVPSLLPSDDDRRIHILKFPLQQEQHENFYGNLNSNNVFPNRYVRSPNFIELYVSRFLKRFKSIPLSLFKSAEIPVPVLTSHCSVNIGNDLNVCSACKSHCSCYLIHNLPNKNVKTVTEYGNFSQPVQQFVGRVLSDSSLSSNYCNLNTNKQPSALSSGNKVLCDKIKDDCPQYAPVGAFSFNPRTKRNYSVHSNLSSISRSKFENDIGKSKEKSLFRKTPAITAPPLTPEQKKATESLIRKRRTILTKSPNQLRNESSFKRCVGLPEKSKIPICNNLPSKIGDKALSTVEENDEIYRSVSDTTKLPLESEPSAYFMC